jgi:hypothetical protein
VLFVKESVISRGLERLLLGVCVLALCPDLRVGNVQLVEIAFLALLASAPHYCLGKSAYRELNVIRLITGVYILVSICIALSKLNQEFFPPLETSYLKQPGVVTLARAWQLLCVLGLAIAVGKFCAGAQENRFRVAFVVTCVGGLSVLASFVAWLALKAGYELPFGVSHGDRSARWCGFFNEGGPFGLCLVGVIVLQLWSVVEMRRLSLASATNLMLLSAGLVMSQSKAALLALVLCALAAFLLCARRAFATTLLGLICITCLLWVVVGANAEMRAGAESYYSWWAEDSERDVSSSRDYNVVAGRIAAMTIVPNMIHEHPFTGVGLGNYPLVRNNPIFRGRFPDIEIWDLPGLGVMSIVAEVGLPLTLLVMIVIAYPTIVAVKFRASFTATLLAVFPLAAVIASVQYYFAYVWLFIGIALGIILGVHAQVSALDNKSEREMSLDEVY